MSTTIRPTWSAVTNATRAVTRELRTGKSITKAAEKEIVGQLGSAAVAYARRKSRLGRAGRAGRLENALKTAGDVLRFRQWLIDTVADGKVSDKELADLAGRALLAAARGWAAAKAEAPFEAPSEQE